LPRPAADRFCQFTASRRAARGCASGANQDRTNRGTRRCGHMKGQRSGSARDPAVRSGASRRELDQLLRRLCTCEIADAVAGAVQTAGNRPAKAALRSEAVDPPGVPCCPSHMKPVWPCCVLLLLLLLLLFVCVCVCVCVCVIIVCIIIINVY
jgi:hypothetical protein